ncbi:hypothetical protein MtrunA17_Chr4g0073801 [Medicago truncatula]|uniref:Transmembrane protein n=1 Tax=Medicago truncatula TaxID=3880 RepID=A0A396IJM5_MEDTR|nr:hypothetical protein MtrunA17_Chr4g0073801 [Medicago truncatula]
MNNKWAYLFISDLDISNLFLCLLLLYLFSNLTGKHFLSWICLVDLLETMFNGLQRREAKGRIFEKGIFVLSRLYVRSDAPRQLISDVAVINWDEGRNFK